MMEKLIIEVDITHRCNLICRHCNRLCNAENQYAIVRNSLDMDMRHIDYLCREIKSIRKGSIETIRILGGEPLLSKILEPAVQAFELLKDEGYISNINIVTNGTLPIPAYCSPYIVFAPQIVGQMIEDKGRPLTKNEIYSIKNIKHRNITLSPEDIGADYKICDRINICGIHYTVYGFSYTAPCFPCIMAKQSNHKYFLHEFPKDVSMFIRGTERSV